MPKTRVLLVNKLYYPWIGGVEKHVQDLAEGLSDEFDVRILACDETSSYQRSTINCQFVNGIAIYKVPSLGLYWSMPIAPTFPFWLKKLAQETDIIHFHLPFPMATVSWLTIHFSLERTTHNAQRRTIITWHSDIIRQKSLNFFLKPFTNRFLKKANAIVVSSPKMLDSCLEIQNFKNKTHIIPLGIDLSRYELTPEIQTKSEEIKKRFGKPLVLFVGRFVPYKGLEYLVEAIKNVTFPATFLLIGDGPLKPKLESLTGRLQIQDRVFFDKAAGNDLVPYYWACDFLVLPSITPNEAFGLIQLEAMVCGKPVINTSLSTGVPWVSLDGETGLTVEPKNSAALAQAINKLLDNRDLRETLGQNARKRVEKHFSRTIMCQKISSLYKSLSFDKTRNEASFQH